LQKQRIENGSATDKDRFDYNRFGASMGGPVKHDKLFVFGAYEFQNEGLASSGASVVMPTSAGLAQLQALNPDSAVGALLAQFPLAPTSNGKAHCNAGSGDPVASFSCVNGQAVDVGTFQSVAPSYSNQHDFTVNGDANLGKHQLRGRFLYDRLRLPQVNPVQPQAEFTGTQSVDLHRCLEHQPALDQRIPRVCFPFKWSEPYGSGYFFEFPQRRNRSIRQQRWTL